MNTITRAREAGYRSRYVSLRKADNPFQEGALHGAWESGWDTAEHEIKEPNMRYKVNAEPGLATVVKVQKVGLLWLATIPGVPPGSPFMNPFSAVMDPLMRHGYQDIKLRDMNDNPVFC